jgi:carboxymethylenebutenolidase
MCVDHDARLPALPPSRIPAVGERIQLTAADGNVFDVFDAQSSDSNGGAVVVLPDVRGLFGFYEDLALRFAGEGFNAVAIDYFGRTAGTGPRDADFPFMEHVAKVDSTGFGADVAAAVSHLRSQDAHARVYTVGFCFGGNMSWAAATRHDELLLSGAVAFYGKPEADRPLGDGPIWGRCHLIRSPVLSIFGGDDPGIPPENIERLRVAMEDAGVDHQAVTYPGAPHSFFDRTQADHAAAAGDAWGRIMEFMA